MERKTREVGCWVGGPTTTPLKRIMILVCLRRPRAQGRQRKSDRLFPPSSTNVLHVSYRFAFPLYDVRFRYMACPDEHFWTVTVPVRTVYKLLHSHRKIVHKAPVRPHGPCHFLALTTSHTFLTIVNEIDGFSSGEVQKEGKEAQVAIAGDIRTPPFCESPASFSRHADEDHS